MKNSTALSDIEEILNSQSYKPKKLPSLTQDKPFSIKSPNRLQRRPTRLTTAPYNYSFPNSPTFFSPNSLDFASESSQTPTVPCLNQNPSISEFKVPKFPKRKFGDCQEKNEPISGFLSVKPTTSEKDILRLKKSSGRVSLKQKRRLTDRFEFTHELKNFKYVVNDVFGNN